MPTEFEEVNAPPESENRRRLKLLLRYLPRRAVLHRYPVVGRFAPQLRPRDYLWSIRRPQVRRAYYLGSLISFLPLMGIQIPLSLVVALLFRANFMVMGGLQLLTNPVTAVPVYSATYYVGSSIVGLFEADGPEVPVPPLAEETKQMSTAISSEVTGLITDPERPPATWSSRFRAAMSSFMVGGVVVGLALGLLLDGLDLLWRRSHERAVRRRMLAKSVLLAKDQK